MRERSNRAGGGCGRGAAPLSQILDPYSYSYPWSRTHSRTRWAVPVAVPAGMYLYPYPQARSRTLNFVPNSGPELILVPMVSYPYPYPLGSTRKCTRWAVPIAVSLILSLILTRTHIFVPVVSYPYPLGCTRTHAQVCSRTLNFVPNSGPVLTYSTPYPWSCTVPVPAGP